MENKKPEVATISLEKAFESFLESLEGKNRSPLTIKAYTTDILSFISFLHENNTVIKYPSEVERVDITEYLLYLSRKDLTGVSRSRKLSAIKEYFKCLEQQGHVDKSPAEHVDSPKREKGSRTYLQPHEYTKMLSLAGSSPRDYAILQVFLQTGVRVSELANLTLDDLDLDSPTATIKVKGKGQIEREIELEKKGIQAIKNYLAQREKLLSEISNTLNSLTFTNSNILFLNYKGEPLSERGIRKLVVKYKQQAGITKKASCHSLRHTFATFKAERGVSPYQLQQWLGHANLNTTQIYVHLGKQNAKKAMANSSL